MERSIRVALTAPFAHWHDCEQHRGGWRTVDEFELVVAIGHSDRHCRICQTVRNAPVAVSTNDSETATSCPKVTRDAHQATIAVSPRPKTMSNSATAIQYSSPLLREAGM